MHCAFVGNAIKWFSVITIIFDMIFFWFCLIFCNKKCTANYSCTLHFLQYTESKQVTQTHHSDTIWQDFHADFVPACSLVKLLFPFWLFSSIWDSSFVIVAYSSSVGYRAVCEVIKVWKDFEEFKERIPTYFATHSPNISTIRNHHWKPVIICYISGLFCFDQILLVKCSTRKACLILSYWKIIAKKLL